MRIQRQLRRAHPLRYSPDDTFVMLLYRPLLTAYRRSPYLPVRRYLLREFAQPRLHAEPDEILEDLAQVGEVSMVQVAERLAAEVSLRERLLRLRLTTGEFARQTGGIWTYHAQAGAVMSWTKSTTQSPSLTRAAGDWLGPVALSLLKRSRASARAEVLAALGDLGEDLALGPLANELMAGAMPEAAAVGLARMGGDAAARTVESAVDARGTARSAGFLGVALRGLPAAGDALLERLVRAPEAEVREAVAWALGNQPPKKVRGLVDALRSDPDSFVRLNLLSSLARLRLPDSLPIVQSCYASDSNELVRTAAIRASGALPDAGAPAFLEWVLKDGSPAERAEALQSLVSLQVPGEPYLAEARRAASSASGRLKLLGLLALVVWAPEEAFERVRHIVSGQPSDEWFVATYALRYLDDSSAARLLKRLCDASRGSELEEIAVDALVGHVDRSGVVEFLINHARGARPFIVERIMQEFARHLPADDAMPTAAALREMIDARPGPAIAGPILVALGSLGGAEDVARAVPHLDGEAAIWAVYALELLMADSALPYLHALAQRTDEPASGHAVTALLRLGDPVAADELQRFSQGPAGVERASMALLNATLSVRHVRSVRRLALLHAALQDRSRVSGEIPLVYQAIAVKDQEKLDLRNELPPGARHSSFDTPAPRARPDFLDRLEKHADLAEQALPHVGPAPSPGASSRVYQDLGQHLTGSARPPVHAGVRGLVAALLVLLVVMTGAFCYVRELLAR